MKIEEFKLTILKRLAFIEFQLCWEGSIGRKKLQDHFSISPQQATKDINAYLDICPDNLSYDPRQKTYIANPQFKPMINKCHASEYLMQLDDLLDGVDKTEVWIKDIPEFDAVINQPREIPADTLKAVLKAIRERKAIRAHYTSVSFQDAGKRTLVPHALARDNHRWHMRAYDVDKQRYSDFVLSRLKEISDTFTIIEPIPEDEAWSNYVELILIADPTLSVELRMGLENEFNMKNGELILKVRQALLYYYLRYYGFNPQDTEENKMKNKSSFRLSIKNIDEVETSFMRRNFIG